MPINFRSFTKPQAPFDPTYDDAARQRALSEALKVRALQVPQNLSRQSQGTTSALASVANALLSNYAGTRSQNLENAASKVLQGKNEAIANSMGSQPSLGAVDSTDEATPITAQYRSPQTGGAINMGAKPIVDALAGQDPRIANQVLLQAKIARAFPAPASFEGIGPGSAIVNKATGEVVGNVPNKEDKPPADDHVTMNVIDPTSKEGYKTIRRSAFDPTTQKEWIKPNAPNLYSFEATDEQNRPTAEAMAAGDIPLRQGNRLTANDLRLNAMAKSINGDLQGSDYYLKKAGAVAFGPGKLGTQVRSFNVGLTHLDTLQQMGQALDNGDTQLFNKIANAWAEQTGQPAPSTYKAAVQIVGQEITKSIVGAGGGERERQEAAKNISMALAPGQRDAAFAGLRTLMGGQLQGLQKQYESSRQTRPFADLLTDTAKQYVTKRPAPAAAPGALPSGRETVAPVRIQSDAEYSNLPSGTTFIAPDGSTRTKP